MEAIILAGGFGTRLRAVVPDLPKPMAPIDSTPFLEVLLNALARKGFKHIVLSLGYKAEVISAYFGNSFKNMHISYCVEDAPLGTGGAVRLAMTQCKSDHVFIFNGDTFLDLEVDALEAFWQKNHRPIIVARQVPDTYRYGRLIVEDGRICGFMEKGIAGEGLINAGCYVLGVQQLNAWPVNVPFSLEADYFVPSVQTVHIECLTTKGLFIDIGIPEDYQLAQSILSAWV